MDEYSRCCNNCQLNGSFLPVRLTLSCRHQFCLECINDGNVYMTDGRCLACCIDESLIEGD